MARKIFFSFHFDNDVFRVQQVRNIGALEDKKPISLTDWENVKRGGNEAIKKWIDETMKDCDCVVVLIGSETAKRPWVDYEVRKAWNSGKGLLGMYIHNLKCPKNGKCSKGANPFDNISLTDGRKLSSIVKCYEPDQNNAYNSIKNGMEKCVEDAIKSRKQ